MKIKRFEADNMSEALRMIKKEFGEDAVILSAKSMKKSGRLLGLGSGSQVVVTAAVDHESTRPSSLDDQVVSSPEPEKSRDAGASPAEKSHAGIGRILQHFTPITRTGIKKMQPKIVQLMSESQETATVSQRSDSVNRSILDDLVEQGLIPSVAVELADKVAELIPRHQPADDETVSALAQIIEAKGWIAQHTKKEGTQRLVVMVGPCGVGKTTMVAKMAARVLMQGRQQVAIMSLDDQRIAGTAELEKYAQILGVPFESVDDEERLRQAMLRLGSADLVLIDTPGLGPADIARRDTLAQLLRSVPESEIQLLVHTGTQERVIIKTINFFRPLGINRLLPTHFDWCGQLGPVISQVALNRLPVGYLGTSGQVPEGLQTLSAQNLAAMLLSQAETKQEPDTDVTVIASRKKDPNFEQYVANRNSDIFHHHQCKAVSRINDDNILIFKDSNEAMDQGFKPCRMCCMSLFVPKPIDRPVRRHAAGFRN